MAVCTLEVMPGWQASPVGVWGAIQPLVELSIGTLQCVWARVYQPSPALLRYFAIANPEHTNFETFNLPNLENCKTLVSEQGRLA